MPLDGVDVAAPSPTMTGAGPNLAAARSAVVSGSAMAAYVHLQRMAVTEVDTEHAENTVAGGT